MHALARVTLTGHVRHTRRRPAARRWGQIAELRAEQRTQIADVRTEIANLETRLIRWMVGTVIATATLTVGILRLIG